MRNGSGRKRLSAVPDRPAAGAEPGGAADRGSADGPDQAPEQADGSAPGSRPEPAALWHVTLSVAGEPAPTAEVRQALERLVNDHPPLMTSRYAADHAEIRYWEEARDLQDAAALALRLWGEYRTRAGLPPWRIVGLEVVDRMTYRRRLAEGYGPPPVVAGRAVRPF